MNELLYVGMATLVSAIGSMVLAYRHRRPHSLEGGVEEFSRGLEALAPEPAGRGGRRSG